MLHLKDVLQGAHKQGVAVGHFNVSDLVVLKAVFTAARDVNVPVIVGASEGERAFMGVSQIAVLVKSLRDEYDFPIFLNADHTRSRASAEEVARAGFDSIVFDLSALPLEQNVRQTREAVATLKAIHPTMLVEGEIGDIGSGSEIHETISDTSKKADNSRRGATVRRRDRYRYSRSSRREHAWHVPKHGAGRIETAPGY